jgi:hypothetical protein
MFTRIIALVLLVGALTSCGTVSSSSEATGTAYTGKKFQRVLVQDFTHTITDDDGTTPVAARKFSDKIAAAIRAKNPSASVSRAGRAGPGTLVVGGEVTRYVEGNAALRFLVGMGAGSSYFDANVRLTDGATGKTLSTLKVDKNSWGMGGAMASAQNVDSFMDQGAKATAKEASPMLP